MTGNPSGDNTVKRAGIHTGSAREPLFHLSKRPSIPQWKAWLIRLAAIALGMLVSSLIACLLSEKIQNGSKSITDVFQSFIDGSFKTENKVWKYFGDTAQLLCISLALVPAFRMRFWNIGGEGQTLVGVLAAIGINFYFGKQMPEWALLIAMLGAAILAGIIWALIPGIFRAVWGTNETLFTLMMNYVATYLVSYFLIIWAGKNGSSLSRMKQGALPVIGDQKYLLIILIAAALAGLMYVYLTYTKHGYEISVVGESVRTARYVGINEKKVIIRTVILSGALCGLVGFLIAGLDLTMTTDSVKGQGFTGIMVAWLGKNNPLFMVLTASFIELLDHGAAQISKSLNVPGAFPSVLVGIILFFTIGCEFFIEYRIHFRGHHGHAGKEGAK